MSRPPFYVQRMFGLRIRTPWKVRGAPQLASARYDVAFVTAPTRDWKAAGKAVPGEQRARWFQSARLPDGTRFFRWNDLFEFLIVPGRPRVAARRLPRAAPAAFQAYLLNQALAQVLVDLGVEPLHATAVATPHGLAAFIGDSGAGKSTLAGVMIAGGSRLLTDDMLVLRQRRGAWWGQPGPARLKLYRAMARRILGHTRGVPMNPSTTKLIFHLPAIQATAAPQPLRAVYLLAAAPRRPVGAPRLRRLQPSAAFPRLLAATLNATDVSPQRLRRQFALCSALAREIPVKLLSYPRTLAAQAAVRELILADLARLDVAQGKAWRRPREVPVSQRQASRTGRNGT